MKKILTDKQKRIKLLLQTIRRRKKAGKSCLQLIINGKVFYFPFEGLDEKPTVIDCEPKVRNKWKQQQKDFILLRDYYYEKNN